MPAFLANPGKFGYYNNGNWGHFYPSGKLLFVGDKAFLTNPKTWQSDEQIYAARIFCALEKQDPETGDVLKAWSLKDDMVPIVKEVRDRQAGDPGSSFIAQTGLYRHKKTGRIIEEDSAQIIILSLYGETPVQFNANMVQLAEILAGRFEQEEVVVEMQLRGVTQEVFGVEP
jgi:hypothetical protein